jgi:hypothetical protein
MADSLLKTVVKYPGKQIRNVEKLAYSCGIAKCGKNTCT